jgi:cytochrome c553
LTAIRRLVAVLVGVVGLAAAAAARTPDTAHGREIALNGTPGGAQACASCHKLDGTGETSGAFPRLTGQGGFYLYKQLKDYADGLRDNQVMSPIAQHLSEAEKQDVAGWYASAPGPFMPPQTGDPRLLQRGGILSAVGSAENNIPACANCHGRAGAGMPPSFPYLAGQYARYIRDQFAAWKDGSRRNDPLNVMRDIAARLPDGDLDAVAEYFAHAYPSER